MKTLHFFKYLVVVITFLFMACVPEPVKETVKKEIFSGYAQKGPFVIGSSVTILELDEHLNQTGKTYFTTISNNLGSFEQKNIELVSNYVELKADGYYFNEVSGELTGPITLYALVDIADINSANVNVLTHLEKPRVEYLVKKGMNFADAKEQAQQEILAIFDFKPTQTSSEILNLTDDAMLIAISCIFQGNLSTGDMMALMASISADIKTDGILNDMTLRQKLIANAYSILFSMDKIRNHMETKYAELGNYAIIPNFESYLLSFLESKPYSQTFDIMYPKTGLYGDNILSDEVTAIRRGEHYSMYAYILNDSRLKIVLRIKDTDFRCVHDNSATNSWKFNYDLDSAPDYGLEYAAFHSCDMQVQILTAAADMIIEYYEYDSKTPT